MLPLFPKNLNWSLGRTIGQSSLACRFRESTNELSGKKWGFMAFRKIILTGRHLVRLHFAQWLWPNVLAIPPVGYIDDLGSRHGRPFSNPMLNWGNLFKIFCNFGPPPLWSGSIVSCRGGLYWIAGGNSNSERAFICSALTWTRWALKNGLALWTKDAFLCSSICAGKFIGRTWHSRIICSVNFGVCLSSGMRCPSLKEV